MAGTLFWVDAIQVFIGAEDHPPPHVHAVHTGEALEQANRILTETEGPGGGFLDDGSAFGLYSRLNLYEAAGRAAASAPK
jgi:hypothetical protein